jgi:hypothetical protein
MSSQQPRVLEISGERPFIKPGNVVVVMAPGTPGGSLGQVGICTDLTRERGVESYVILFENGHLQRLMRKEAEGTLRVTAWTVASLINTLHDSGVLQDDVLPLAKTGTGDGG